MSPTARRARRHSSTGFAGLLLAVVVLPGCVGCSGQPSSEERLEREFKEHPEFKKESLSKFSGHVTIDGQPPAQGTTVFVILGDPKHMDDATHLQVPKLFTSCKPDGSFSFHTYLEGDGVPAGKYVLMFVGLHKPQARRQVRSQGNNVFIGPDELKNLYNDPDKNSKNEKFALDLQSPGKDDYEFNLEVAGKPPVDAPGANSWTRIATNR